MNGFNGLEELVINRADNLAAFQYLPPLPSLQVLFVWYCPELNQIPFPDLSSAKLKELVLWNNEISNEKADEIMDKLVDTNSADSLEKLDLTGNYLTRIPSRVRSAFPKLKNIFLADNSILHIPSYSLTFAYPLEELDFYI